uniref:Galectin n=1 Tax=Accipiter nisus TaxID=211598 RepID=A0A8B9NB31_9AVES
MSPTDPLTSPTGDDAAAHPPPGEWGGTLVGGGGGAHMTQGVCWGPGKGGSCPHPSPVLCPLQPVPFVATIPGGLIPKKTIVVKGYIPPDAERFHINLRAGPGGDVLLHLNPRLDEGVVVRNSLLGGVWGSEEQDLPYNPFQRGRYFDVSAQGRGGGMRVGVTRGWELHEGLHRTRTGVTRGWELHEGSRCVKTHRAGGRVLHVGGCRCR